MAEGAPSGQCPRASARLVAAAESALPQLLRALGGDLLRAVATHLDDADLLCFRLACRAFRDHSSPAQGAQGKSRRAFLHTRALAVFAWERMPGFVFIASPWRPSMLSFAASIGRVDVLEELVDKRQCALTADASAAAVKKGHLDAVAWLHSRGCPCDSNTCSRAALGGHLEVLRYAHEHGCPWITYTCYCAALGGHLGVLRYALEHGCPWDSNTCYGAALGGHLEALQYAHEHGFPWDRYTCWSSAERGHLEVLRYAHEHGCPWDRDTCSYAALEGHLEALRYAHEHGCPWELDRCLAMAMRNGYVAVVDYLRAAQPAA